jgi:hypothetical protein
MSSVALMSGDVAHHRDGAAHAPLCANTWEDASAPSTTVFGYHTGFVLSSSVKSDRTMTKRRRPTVVAMSCPVAISS